MELVMDTYYLSVQQFVHKKKVYKNKQ